MKSVIAALIVTLGIQGLSAAGALADKLIRPGGQDHVPVDREINSLGQPAAHMRAFAPPNSPQLIHEKP